MMTKIHIKSCLVIQKNVQKGRKVAENMSKTPRNRHSRICVCTLKHKREVNALILDKNVFTAIQFALTLSISSIQQLSFSLYSVSVYAHSFFLSYFVCVCVYVVLLLQFVRSTTTFGQSFCLLFRLISFHQPSSTNREKTQRKRAK